MENQKYITLPESLIKEYFVKKDQKVLHAYALAMYFTANRGYIAIDEFTALLKQHVGISASTIKRFIDTLESRKLLFIKKGILHPISRKRLAKNKGYFIKFPLECLSSYIRFRNHSIQQVALIEQRRFKYLLAISIKNQGNVDQAPPSYVKTKEKAGCSLSKLVENMGVNKMTASKALAGGTTPQYNLVKKSTDFYAMANEVGNLYKHTNNFRYTICHFKASKETCIIYRLSNKITFTDMFRRNM